MDSDDNNGEPSSPPAAETGRPSLFGAVMAGQNRRKRGVDHTSHDNVAVSNDTGDDDFVGRGGGGIDIVEATRFPSMNDDSVDISTPSPKSRRGSSSSSRGRGSGGAGSGGRRRSGGLFGDIGGGDGSNSGTSSRFASMASPGGYGIMDILNNMDDDTHHFEDSNFDKVESPSKSAHREVEDGEEKGDSDDAPPKWKEAAFVAPKWLLLSRDAGEDALDGPTSSPKGSEIGGGGDNKEEGESDEIQNVRIKEESQSEMQHDGPDDDEDVYDLPTQPPPDAQNRKRKRSPLSKRTEAAVPTDVPTDMPINGSLPDSTPDASGPSAMSIGILDWTLKRRLRLECCPRRALPLSSSSSLSSYSAGSSGHEAVDRLATRIFLRPSTGFDGVGNANSEDVVRGTANISMPAVDPMTIAAAQWKAAQMYWRHPAVYPLPPQLLMPAIVEPSKGWSGGGSFDDAAPSGSRNNNPAKKALRFASSSTLTSTEEEAAAIREAADKIQQRQAASLSAMGFGASASGGFSETSSNLSALMGSPTEIIRRRQSEWAEAFRSMYYTWLERIDELRMAGATSHRSLSIDEVARTYFYLVLPSQTILFRCQVRYLREDDVEGEDTACTIHPVILLSSTTSGLRSELRHMGVSIYVLDDVSTGTGIPFDDSIFDIKPEELKQSKAEEDEARKVRDELEALRRAGAQGHTAGAEVSVSIGKKTGAMSHEAKSKKDDQIFRPLYVEGDDDCMAIYELLLNTRGRLFNSEDDNDGADSDVPLLLHRSLGPTRNALIGTLSETMRLDENHDELKMMRDREVKTSDEAASDDELSGKLQINGPILPCAVRDLMSASICHLLLDEMNGDAVRKEEEEDDDDNVGSHYLVWYPSRQEGFGSNNGVTALKVKGSGREYSKKKASRRLAMYKRETGNPTSSHFNGGNFDRDLGGVENCGSQQLLKQVIWVSNPQSTGILSYNTATALE